MAKTLLIITIVLSSSCMLPISLHADVGDQIAKRFRQSFRFEDKGDFPAALNEIIKVLQLAPNNYTAVLRSGWLYHLCGYHRDSIAQYRKAMALRPKAIEPIQGIMLPLIKSRRLEEAVTVAQRGLRLDKHNYLINIRLADCLYTQGKYAQAARLFAKILELYPSNLQVQLGLAWSNTKIGKLDHARNMFSSVLLVNPSNVSALAGMKATRVRFGAVRGQR